MKLIEKDREVEISDANWSLAKDLFIKWGYETESPEIAVSDIDKITCELSAWGIPWKRVKWEY